MSNYTWATDICNGTWSIDLWLFASLKIIIGNYFTLRNRVYGKLSEFFIIKSDNLDTFFPLTTIKNYKFIFSVWLWNIENLIRENFRYCSRFWFVEKTWPVKNLIYGISATYSNEYFVASACALIVKGPLFLDKQMYIYSICRVLMLQANFTDLNGHKIP